MSLLVYGYLVILPETSANNTLDLRHQGMLHSPHVGEDKTTHVRESRDFGFVMHGVIGPDESSEVLHKIQLRVRICWICSRAWGKEMNRDPCLDRFSQHVLMQARQVLAPLVDASLASSEPGTRGFPP